MPPPFFTIGHSTRPIQAIAALLREAEVERVVDIRTVPRSRTNPQYNADVLGAALAPLGIGYGRIEALGGLRSRSVCVAAETNGWWDNRSFHNYADHALTSEFREGLAELAVLAERRRCALMCAEAVWWRCHRRIVADYLLTDGWEVFHLMGDDRVEPARITPAAVRAGDGLHYPAPDGAGLPDVRA